MQRLQDGIKKPKAPKPTRTIEDTLKKIPLDHYVSLKRLRGDPPVKWYALILAGSWKGWAEDEDPAQALKKAWKSFRDEDVDIDFLIKRDAP